MRLGWSKRSRHLGRKAYGGVSMLMFEVGFRELQPTVTRALFPSKSDLPGVVPEVAHGRRILRIERMQLVEGRVGRSSYRTSGKISTR